MEKNEEVPAASRLLLRSSNLTQRDATYIQLVSSSIVRPARLPFSFLFLLSFFYFLTWLVPIKTEQLAELLSAAERANNTAINMSPPTFSSDIFITFWTIANGTWYIVTLVRLSAKTANIGEYLSVWKVYCFDIAFHRSSFRLVQIFVIGQFLFCS